MPNNIHPDISALIAAAAVMREHGEPVGQAVLEKIGRAECERMGLNPDRGVNQSGLIDGTLTPQWKVSAEYAITAVRSLQNQRRNVLVPNEIHARLEALERAVGLSP